MMIAKAMGAEVTVVQTPTAAPASDASLASGSWSAIRACRSVRKVATLGRLAGVARARKLSVGVATLVSRRSSRHLVIT